MALATGFLNDIYGVLGDCVIVHIKGKAYIKRRPKKSKNPPTELALAKKAKFRVAGKLAGKISSLEEIKHFWKPDKEKNQTAYNRMFHANHGSFDIGDMSGRVILSEGAGLEVNNPSIEFKESGVVINCDSFESMDAKKREDAKYIRGAGIVVLTNPFKKALRDLELMTLRTKDCLIEKGGKFTGEVTYFGGDNVKFNSFAARKAFGVLITSDGEWNLTDISKTFESELDGEIKKVEAEEEIKETPVIVESESAQNIYPEVTQTDEISEK